jgi:Spy/CpxP family protein refolding chaperone
LLVAAAGFAAFTMPALAQQQGGREPRPEQRQEQRRDQQGPRQDGQRGPQRDGAQGPQGRPQPGMLIERFQQEIERLDLSAEQKAQLKTIFGEARTKLAAARQQQGPEIRETIRSIVEETREKALAQLTPEQKQKVQDVRQRMMQDGQAPLQRLQDALKELNLSEEQMTKVQAIMSAARDEARKLHEGAEPGANRDAMMKLLRDTREKLVQVLTPEQAEKLRTAAAGVRPGRAGTAPGAAQQGPGGKPDDTQRAPRRERGDK